MNQMNQQIIADRYEIKSLIDTGGMGRVFYGLDHKTGLPVAIKQLIDDHIADNPELIQRFQREGELLKQLNHPNIVRVLSSLHANDSYFIVMEYVGGGSLKTLLAEQSPLPLPRALEIALDIADALTRMHRLAIIHRDIKPANVLMAEDGTPRLSDFGIARQTKQHTHSLTTTGTVLGTYAYLSPEACRGEDLDHRTDIWSFGVMLYEMLSGKRPFTGEHEASVLISIMQEDPHPLHQARPEIPQALAQLVDQMLVKDREQRIDSIRDVGTRIERILRNSEAEADAIPSRFDTPTDSLPIAVSPTPTPQTAPDHATRTFTPKAQTTSATETARPRSSTSLLTFLVILLLFGLGAAFLGIVFSNAEDESDPTDEPNIAVVNVEADNAPQMTILVAALEPIDTTRTDPARFMVTDLQQKLNPSTSQIAVDVIPYPEIISSREEADAVAETNKAEVILWGNYDSELAEINVQLGSLASYPPQIDRRFVEEVTELQVRLEDPRRESVFLPTLAMLAWMQSAAGNGPEVTNILAQLQLINHVSGELVGTPAAVEQTTALQVYLDDIEQAERLVEAVTEKLPANPLPYINMAILDLRRGNIAAAERMIDTSERLANSDVWDLPLYQRANITLAEQDYAATMDYYNTLVERRPDDWFVWNFRGFLHYILENYDAARQDYAQAISLRPTNNFSYPILVMLALRDADLSEAVSLIDEMIIAFPDPLAAYYMTQAAYGDEIETIIGPYFAAFGHLTLARYDEAIRFSEDALELNDTLPEPHFMLGFARCNLGELEAADAAYTNAIEQDDTFLAAYLLRADVRNRMGDVVGALEDVRVVQEALAERDADPDPLMQQAVAGNISCETIFQR